MATACLTSSSASLTCKTRSTERLTLSPRSSVGFPYPTNRCFLATSSISTSPSSLASASPVLSSTNKIGVSKEEEESSELSAGDDSPGELRNSVRPRELYVCNLPRSCDISELLELFKPYGTVQSVEVSRNAETGISRGCGYVIMSSIDEAKAAISALDGSDIGGREVRVRFSVDMNSARENIGTLNSVPQKNLVFESPYKVYVGNIAWSVRPQDLKEHFSQFGTVISTRILYDRKSGMNRVYGFLSFSSAAELEAAVSSGGTELHGRTLIVREVVKTSES